MLSHEIVLSSSIEDALQPLNKSEEYSLLLHCLSGKLRVESEEKQYTLTTNDLLLCRPELIRDHYMQSPDFTCRAITVRRHALDDLVYGCLREDDSWWEKSKYLIQHPVIHLSDRQLELMSLFDRLFRLYDDDENQELSEKIRKIFVEAAILELLRWLENKVPSSDPMPKQGRQEVLFREFVKLLQQEKGLRREVQWYAGRLNVTPKYLSFVCRKFSGKPALALVNEMAVQEIKRMLHKTDMSTKEICNRMNFASLTFFCKYVKQHLGMAANEYRQQARKGNVF